MTLRVRYWKSDTNKLALSEVLGYISIRDEKIRLCFEGLKEHFMKSPMGGRI